MASAVDFTTLVGMFWKCPAAFQGEDYAQDVEYDDELEKFNWVKLKRFVPVKIVKNRATAACFVFDCEDEKNNYIPALDIDMGDIKQYVDGITTVCFVYVHCNFIKRTCFYNHYPHVCADDGSSSEEEEEVISAPKKRTRLQ